MLSSVSSAAAARVHVHERKLRSWKDTPFAGKPVWIVMQSPRVRCLNCGAKTWHQPKFARGQKRYTKNFESHVCRCLSRVTIQDVVEMCGLSWDNRADCLTRTHCFRGLITMRPGRFCGPALGLLLAINGSRIQRDESKISATAEVSTSKVAATKIVAAAV